jgi:hypothetical protein
VKFTIEAAQAHSNGLRVIPSLPDMPLCRIEGKNGIGKTLAARLLELVSGVQPFAALPHAWTSLVDNLGTVKILIEGFEDDGVIECVLDSSTWAGRTPMECAANPGLVSRNGSPISWVEARKRFQVRRIAGDEGLQETLGRLMRERALEAERTATTLSAKLSAWANDLRRLRSLTAQSKPSQLAEARLSTERLAAKADQVKAERRRLSDRLTWLSTTSTDLAKRSSAVATLPSLVEEYRTHRLALDAALTAASEDDKILALSGISDQVSAERGRLLRRWARLLQLRERARDRAANDAQYWRLLANIEDGEQPVQVSLELKQQLKELNTEIDDGFMAGRLRLVLGDLLPPLDKISSSEIANQVFATIDRPIRGSELRTAISNRRTELTGIPKPESTAKLERSRDAISRRIAALGQVPQADEALVRKQDLVDEASRQMDDLLSKNEGGSNQREVLNRLSANRMTLTAASSESGRVAFEIATLIGQDPTSLGISLELPSGDEEETLSDEAIESMSSSTGLPTAERIAEFADAYLADSHSALEAEGVVGRTARSNDLSLDLSTLSALFEENLAAERELLADLNQQDSQLEQELLFAGEKLAGIRLAIRSTLAEFTDPNSTWSDWKAAFDALVPSNFDSLRDLRDSLEHEPRTEQMDVEVLAASFLARLDSMAEDIEESAALTRDTWSTVAAYLEATARRLAPRLATTDGPSFSTFQSHESSEALRRWTEAELAHILSSDALRRELFDDATEVFIDLEELAVLWRTASGHRRRRPLEAFSSGEQVFAYTRAKLDQLSNLKNAAHRTTIILDEFGAFVARDRFGQLMKYVEDEAVGITADQIIVMLPWSGIAPSVGGQEEASKATRELEERGYFAVSGIAGSK